VQDLVIVSTNTSQTPISGFTHSLRVANGCALPKRFDGTWTRVYTWPDQGTLKETLNGTATLLRNSEFPPEADQLSAVPYEVQSASVVWNVTGSFDPTLSCRVTYSGSGTDTPIPDHSALTTTDLQLENVTGRPGAPNPEPQPFYYSIRSGTQTFDPANAPMYDVTDCHGTQKAAILVPLFELGNPNPFTPDLDPATLAKSADPRLLAGHRIWSEPDRPTIQIDDTWSFKGSD